MANKKSKKKVAPGPASKKKVAPSPASKGLSARAQWGLIIGVGVLLFGGFVFLQVRESLDPGGTGVFTAEDWDLPALDADLDTNGDGRVPLGRVRRNAHSRELLRILVHGL